MKYWFVNTTACQSTNHLTSSKPRRSASNKGSMKKWPSGRKFSIHSPTHVFHLCNKQAGPTPKSGPEAPRILKWSPEGLGPATTMESPVGQVGRTGTRKVETQAVTATRITQTVDKAAGMVVGPTHLKGVGLRMQDLALEVEPRIIHKVGLMVVRAVGLILVATATISTIGNDGRGWDLWLLFRVPCLFNLIVCFHHER